MVLQERHRGGHRRVVAGPDLLGHLGAAEGPQHRDRLGRRQRQRVAGHHLGTGSVVERPPEGLAGQWVPALAEQGGQVGGVDLAGQAEAGGTRAGPASRRLAPAGEVVLQAEGDLAGVVAPSGRRHVDETQHVSPLARNVAEREWHRRVQRCPGMNPSWR